MGNGIVYIYGLVDPRKDEIFYIGFTMYLKKRYNVHLNVNGSRKVKNLYKDNTIRKILSEGLKPEMRVLDSCEKKKNNVENKYEHELLEIKYIKEYREKGIKLTNITDGGDGGRTKTKKVYQYSEDGVFLNEYSSHIEIMERYNIDSTLISKVIDQKLKKSYRETYFFSSKENAKLFKFKKTRKCVTPIVQYSLNGDFIKEYKSQVEAARKTNIEQSNINCCLKGKYIQTGGYYWYYRNNIPERIPEFKGNSISRIKIILQYSLNGDFIKEYKSQVEAARKTNINGTGINSCLKEKNKHAGGYYWYYKHNVPEIIPKYYDKYLIISKPLIQYDLNGEIIKEFDSITKAAKELNIAHGLISHNLRKKTKTCKGFVFEYKNN